MNEKLTSYLDEIFSPYEELRTVKELKEELGHDLRERMADLKEQGMSDEEALAATIDSVGDIQQTIADIAEQSRALQRMVNINFSASDMQNADLKNVTVHDGKFSSSALKGTDFSGSDLSGSSFKASDLRNARFDGANLTGAKLNMSSLENASFANCRLERADLSCSDLRGAVFTGASLTNTKLTKVDLRTTLFENCTFNGADFSCSDLRGVTFDGASLTGVKFNMAAIGEASFKNAVLFDVSFHHNNKKDVQKAVFEGAKMDKLTYAVLKSYGANLANVTLMTR